MSEALLAFRWYLVLQVFGLAALPLAWRLFRHLPDRGYGVSKPLGLLLAGWGFWLLTTFGWTHNTAGGILVALGLLAAVGLVLVLRSPDLSSRPVSHARPMPLPWRTVLVTEVVFTLAFLAWCLVRARMPRIETAGGEKWMEIAFLRAILRSDTFPPHDPWLSGFAISYYYFGYVIVAMVARLAAVPPAIAFNLGIATLFALTCTGAFSLVYNLLVAEMGRERRNGGAEGGEERDWRKGWGALVGGLLGPLVVAVMGNLEGLLEVLHARGLGPAAWWAWLDIYRLDEPPLPLVQGSWVPSRFFWWWQASRVLQDYTPWGAEQHVIDEFPGFSFLLGDMHPHVLALPFVVLALALALNLYLRIAECGFGIADLGLRNADRKPRMANGESANTQHATRNTQHATRFTFHVSRFAFHVSPWELLIYALCLGGLGFLNTWDFPIYLFVVVAASTLAHYRTTQAMQNTASTAPATEYEIRNTNHVSRFTFHVSRFALLFAALLLPGILLYLPFWIGFQSQAGGILLNLFNATRLPQFLVMFGPLLFIAAAFVAGQARQSGVRVGEVARWTATVALGILGIVVFVVMLGALLVRVGALAEQGPAGYVAAWLRGGPIPGLENIPNASALILRSLLLRLLNPWVALGLIALLVVVVLTVISDQGAGSREQEEHGIGLSFRAQRGISAGLTDQISCFVLLLLATGALLAFSVEYVYLRDNFGTRMNTVFKFYFQAWVVWGIAGAYALANFIRRNRVGMGMVAVLLVAAGFVYPVLAIPARANETGGRPTLDGTAYLAEMEPDDYAAFVWLNQNVSGAPVILEAPGDRAQAYVYAGRVSANTGLPTLLGWAGHEHQWRGSYDEQARREPDIESLYTSVDPREVVALVSKYDIRYIYIGPLERTRYPAAGLAKFAGLGEAVYDAGEVTIYRMGNEQ